MILFYVINFSDEFKPASIDKKRSGTLHKKKDNRVSVEFQNNQPGKPKVTFEGSSEDYKDNDAVLFFDGEKFRLERLHRAVKQLRHLRTPGESAAAVPAGSSSQSAVAPPVEHRVSPPVGRAAKSPHVNRSLHPDMPVSFSMSFDQVYWLMVTTHIGCCSGY